jgi:hypothetical protein
VSVSPFVQNLVFLSVVGLGLSGWAGIAEELRRQAARWEEAVAWGVVALIAGLALCVSPPLVCPW